MQPYSAADYLSMLQALLPEGAAWTRDPDAALTQLLAGIAGELARVDASAHLLIREADAYETLALLAEHESAWGLPDECTQSGATIQERREAVLAKEQNLGGQSVPYFLELAILLSGSSDVAVSEYRPFTAGSPSGDQLTNGTWCHAWRVTAPAYAVHRFAAGVSVAGEPLVRATNERLECVLNRLKPAHSVIHFAYTGGDQ